MSRSSNLGLEKTGFLGAIWAFVQLCLVVAFPTPPMLAQITPDTTLGAEGSLVTPGANVQGLPADLIEGGAQRDTSLFHSFQEFNVNNGQRVYFTNPTGIENILTRVTSNTIDHEARLEANSESAKGGNITIEGLDLLLLRRGSKILAEAGRDGFGGDGGQITINAKDGFVVAVPSEDSDILANAFGGKGGTIDIKALRVLGLQRRSRLTPSQLQNLRNNGTSDISASSDIAGLEGDIEIDTLNLDPAQGLIELPISLVDPTGLIAQGCESRNNAVTKGQSTFVATGRGGLPPNPDNPLSTGVTPPPWVTRDTGRASKAANVATLLSRTPATPVVEAQGMVIGSKGEIILTAGVAGATPDPSGISVPGCSGER